MAKDVVSKAVTFCPFGSRASILLVDDSKHDKIEGENSANVSDHIPIANILPFGLCSSPFNPAVQSALLVPQPCLPLTPFPWTPGNSTLFLDNEKILDDLSVCPCVWAGIITILDAGQNSWYCGDTVPEGGREAVIEEAKAKVEELRATEEGRKLIASLQKKAKETVKTSAASADGPLSKLTNMFTGLLTGSSPAVNRKEKELTDDELVTVNVIPKWRRTAMCKDSSDISTFLRIPNPLAEEAVNEILENFTPENPDKIRKLPDNFSSSQSLLPESSALHNKIMESLTLDKAANLNSGYIYIYARNEKYTRSNDFKKLRLFKEYRIYSSGSTTAFKDISIENSAGLYDRCSGFLRYDIELPYSYAEVNGESVKHHKFDEVYVMYSSVQLGWGRIHHLGGISSKDTRLNKNLPESQMNILKALESSEPSSELIKKRMGAPLDKSQIEQLYNVQYKDAKPVIEEFTGTDSISAWQTHSIYHIPGDKYTVSPAVLLLCDPAGEILNGNILIENLFRRLNVLMAEMPYIHKENSDGSIEKKFDYQYLCSLMAFQLFVKRDYPGIVKAGRFYSTGKDGTYDSNKPIPWLEKDSRELLEMNKVDFFLEKNLRECIHGLIAAIQRVNTDMLLQTEKAAADSYGPWHVDINEVIKDYFARYEFAAGYIAVQGLISQSCRNSRDIDAPLRANDAFINTSSFTAAMGINADPSQYKLKTTTFTRLSGSSVLKTSTERLGSQVVSRKNNIIIESYPAGYDYLHKLFDWKNIFTLAYTLFNIEGRGFKEPGDGLFNAVTLKESLKNSDTRKNLTAIAKKSSEAIEFLISEGSRVAEIKSSDIDTLSEYSERLQNDFKTLMRNAFTDDISFIDEAVDLYHYSINPLEHEIRKREQQLKKSEDFLKLLEECQPHLKGMLLALAVWDTKETIGKLIAAGEKVEADDNIWIMGNLLKNMMDSASKIKNMGTAAKTFIKSSADAGWYKAVKEIEYSENKTVKKIIKTVKSKSRKWKLAAIRNELITQDDILNMKSAMNTTSDILSAWGKFSTNISYASSVLDLLNSFTLNGRMDDVKCIRSIVNNGSNLLMGIGGYVKKKMAEEGFDTALSLARSLAGGAKDAFRREVLMASQAAAEALESRLAASIALRAIAFTASPLGFLVIQGGLILVDIILKHYEHNDFQVWAENSTLGKKRYTPNWSTMLSISSEASMGNNQAIDKMDEEIKATSKGIDDSYNQWRDNPAEQYAAFIYLICSPKFNITDHKFEDRDCLKINVKINNLVNFKGPDTKKIVFENLWILKISYFDQDNKWIINKSKLDMSGCFNKTVQEPGNNAGASIFYDKDYIRKKLKEKRKKANETKGRLENEHLVTLEVIPAAHFETEDFSVPSEIAFPQTMGFKTKTLKYIKLHLLGEVSKNKTELKQGNWTDKQQKVLL